MRYFRMILLFVVAIVAQWWVTAYLSFGSVGPQLLLVLTVAAGSRSGPVTAMCFGFFWGLFLDVFRVHLFGANALLLTLIGYTVGSARRQVDVNGLAPQCVLVLGITWGYFICLGILGLLFLKSFLWVGWRPFMIDPLYNCLMIPFVFFAWDKMVES